MKISSLILSAFTAMVFLTSCEKIDKNINEETLSASVENIKATSATINVTHNFADKTVVKKGVWCSTISSFILTPKTEDYIVSTSLENNFSIDLTKLNAGTTYFLRPYAIYANDTVFGEEIEFITDDYLLFNPSVQYGSATDIDGNKYKTVQIGDQVWMAENLRVTHYRNGEPIMTFETRENFESPVFYWFNNNEDYKEVYGAYYNYMAVSDKRNIAPEGWRVATQSDWEKLFEHIGNKAEMLMEQTSAHWNFGYYPNINNNSTGFTAISSGVANHPYYQGRIGFWASFWTSKTFHRDDFCLAHLDYDKALIVSANGNVFNGYPVRCVKE